MATRRPKGTGSLRHLGGDRWELDFKHDGKRFSRVIRADNATKANREAQRVTGEIMGDRASTSDRRRWTVDQYTAYYFDYLGDKILAPSTRSRYHQLADNQVSPRLGKMRISDVTSSDLRVLYKELGEPGARKDGREGGLSATTIWHTHRFLHLLFAFAVDRKDLPANPADGRSSRPAVKQEPKKPEVLDMQQAERMLAALRESRERGGRLYAPVLLAMNLGLRRSEALALRWCDVDTAARTVTIRRGVTQTKEDGITVKKTKNGCERVIPIDTDTLAELETHRRLQREWRMLHRKTWQGAHRMEDDWICGRPDGSLWEPDAFTSSYRDFCRRHGFENVNYHALRHAFGSHLRSLGFDAVTAAAIMGHSAAVNDATYSHALQDRMRQASEDFQAARKAARKAVSG